MTYNLDTVDKLERLRTLVVATWYISPTEDRVEEVKDLVYNLPEVIEMGDLAEYNKRANYLNYIIPLTHDEGCFAIVGHDWIFTF